MTERVGKDEVKQKSFESRFENCQRGAFENCLRSGVPDSKCSITKTAKSVLTVDVVSDQ